ncbi:MAG TPA: hypothetical protein VLJ39_19690 [Tepidisphaeraceae bacterium]|nr:hypothetical protein [Tepidisphaeraceae bacterium]
MVEYLRNVIRLRLGHYLNPDALDRELSETGRIKFEPYGIQIRPVEILQFIAQHPLADRARLGELRIDQNTIAPMHLSGF